jgi:hypothetical protein
MKKEDREFNEDNVKDEHKSCPIQVERKGMKASKQVFYGIKILPQVVYLGDLLYKR